MARWIQGVYTVINRKKYIGSHPPVYRSSWELRLMRVLDTHPDILAWCSEPFCIPYWNPVKKTPGRYVPDFLVIVRGRDGKRRVEILEIKPYRQAELGESGDLPRALVVAVNEAKWEAARKFAEARGFVFRVLTEKELFGGIARERHTGRRQRATRKAANFRGERRGRSGASPAGPGRTGTKGTRGTSGSRK